MWVVVLASILVGVLRPTNPAVRYSITPVPVPVLAYQHQPYRSAFRYSSVLFYTSPHQPFTVATSCSLSQLPLRAVFAVSAAVAVAVVNGAVQSRLCQELTAVARDLRVVGASLRKLALGAGARRKGCGWRSVSSLLLCCCEKV